VKIKYRSILVAVIIPVVLLAQETKEQESRYDKIWSVATLYSSEENTVLQKLSFTGRLQYDYYYFDEKDAGHLDDTLWRRARAGFKASLFHDFTVHSEISMDLENMDPEYDDLTDSYISWDPAGDWKITVGKQSAGFTLDGSTSSKRLIAIERSKLSNNIWFTKEYFIGIALSGKSGNWMYNAGIFSNDNGDEFSEVGKEEHFVLLTGGYDFGDALAVDQALLRLDFVYNKETMNSGTNALENILSLHGKFDKESFHLWTEIAYGKGFDREELVGLEIMPFLDLSKIFQLVGRFTLVSSSNDKGVSIGRYEREFDLGKGDNLQEWFLGLNLYLYGHKLKWQNGIQYTRMDDDAKDGGSYNGLGFTSAVRLSW